MYVLVWLGIRTWCIGCRAKYLFFRYHFIASLEASFIHYCLTSRSVRVFISLEMDEEDCERRRMECLDEMSNLEKQFTDLKEQ